MADMSQGSTWIGQVVTPDELITEGAVVTVDGKIAWVGQASQIPAEFDAAPIVELQSNSMIIPGLVDVHCHGGGGASFPDAESLEQVEVAATEHLKHGTTTLIASLVTAPLDVLETRATLLAEATRRGLIQGIHYEGPFLSEARCGAQDPRYLIPATPEVTKRLVNAAEGMAVTMTIAPETCLDDQGKESVRILAEGDILPSWGHTDCSVDQAKSAIQTGIDALKATEGIVRGGRATATHLFNGMRPLHHRDPGPVPAFLSAAKSGEIVVEMINDGIHLEPALVAEVLNLVGRDNAVFVTDAMAAAGMADGSYVLGPQEVRVEGGVARLAHGNAIAGGTSHLLDGVRTAVVKGEVDLVDAVYLASAQGAKILGLKDRGRLEQGMRADLVVTDDNLFPVTVVREGKEVA